MKNLTENKEKTKDKYSDFTLACNLWTMREVYRIISRNDSQKTMGDFYNDIDMSSQQFKRFMSGEQVYITKAITTNFRKFGINEKYYLRCDSCQADQKITDHLLLTANRLFTEDWNRLILGEEKDKDSENKIKKIIEETINNFKKGNKTEPAALFNYWSYYTRPYDDLMKQLSQIPFDYWDRCNESDLKQNLEILNKQLNTVQTILQYRIIKRTS